MSLGDNPQGDNLAHLELVPRIHGVSNVKAGLSDLCGKLKRPSEVPVVVAFLHSDTKYLTLT